MAKLSKDELKAKIDEVVTDEDVKIDLLEDIEDSFEVKSEETEEESEEKISKEEYDKVVAERDEIKKKYKERFLSGEEKDEKEETETLYEKEVVDVKEI